MNLLAKPLVGNWYNLRNGEFQNIFGCALLVSNGCREMLIQEKILCINLIRIFKKRNQKPKFFINVLHILLTLGLTGTMHWILAVRESGPRSPYLQSSVLRSGLSWELSIYNAKHTCWKCSLFEKVNLKPNKCQSRK